MIFGEPTKMIEPGEGSLHDPAFGQYRKAMRLGALDHRHAPIEHRSRPVDQLAGMAAVDEYGTEHREGCKEAREHRTGAHTILNAGGMHDYREQPTLRIDRDVSLATLGFLARLISALPPLFIRSF